MSDRTSEARRSYPKVQLELRFSIGGQRRAVLAAPQEIRVACLPLCSCRASELEQGADRRLAKIPTRQRLVSSPDARMLSAPYAAYLGRARWSVWLISRARSDREGVTEQHAPRATRLWLRYGIRLRSGACRLERTEERWNAQPSIIAAAAGVSRSGYTIIIGRHRACERPSRQPLSETPSPMGAAQANPAGFQGESS